MKTEARFQKYYWLYCAILLFLELILYTEIDWTTYMEHINLFINGVRDYTLIKGSTGPCVYPAGFLYFYTVLNKLTHNGINIANAQTIFIFIYIINLFVVYAIYKNLLRIFPAYVLLFCTLTSHRIHSIFILRLFNDPIAILFLHLSLYTFLQTLQPKSVEIESNKIKIYRVLSPILFSVALSIKMNILLYAPAYMVFTLISQGFFGLILSSLIMFLVQVIIAMPFLMGSHTNAANYLKQAFNFGRQFDFTWTVNWRWIGIEIFSNSTFHIALLVLHLSCLTYLFFVTWKIFGKYWPPLRAKNLSDLKLLWENLAKPHYVDLIDFVWAMFTCNLCGICFARSLHYQFFTWYYYTLPLLIHLNPLCGPFPKNPLNNAVALYNTLFQQSPMQNSSKNDLIKNQNRFKFRPDTKTMITNNINGQISTRTFVETDYCLISKNLMQILKPFIFWLAIEYCWNVYPSSKFSSLLLTTCHGILLYGSLFPNKLIYNKKQL